LRTEHLAAGHLTEALPTMRHTSRYTSWISLRPWLLMTTKSQTSTPAQSAAVAESPASYPLSLITRAVAENESALISRALRIRCVFSSTDQLVSLIKSHVSPEFSSLFLDAVGAMAQDSPAPTTTSPEVDCYMGYLVLLHSYNTNPQTPSPVSPRLLSYIRSQNRRSLDPIQAKIYFYHYLTNPLDRGALLASHKTASLRTDKDSQAVLLNTLLRSYITANEYHLADKLVSKTSFPESAANNQLARYMYYVGRIKAIQLDYTASFRYLNNALRKALTTDATAGFQQAVQKVVVIVQLLMGEIPERSVFRQPMLKKALAPYLKITSAVRVGDLAAFQETLASNSAVFHKDTTYTLILRLRHNVIKAGIRMLSLSYSRISLRDTCLKLQLDSEEDAEYVVSKAIRDGVVDALINHEKGYIKSRENVDIYSTNEPQNAFHQRISFCLNLHNESVQSMRYPVNAHKKELCLVAEIIEEEKKLVQEVMDEENAEMDQS